MGEIPAPGGDVDLAQVERLRFALGGDSRSADAFALLASNYYEAGQLALARLVCENAILLGIDEAVLHNRLGLIALEEGNVIEALAEFRRAVEISPSLISAWVNIGAMSLSFRDYTAALEAFEIVLEARPDDRDVRLSYGAALRGVDQPERAQAEYEAILQAVPTHPGALFNMALLYQEAYQDYPAACGYYFQFIDSAPQSHERYEDADRRVFNLHELLGSLLFLEQATEEQVAACAR
jgi:tetratricopeptide (TPR) repeat protein